MPRVALVMIGPASSIGSPMTFMMRPRHSSPTGTAIGAPVFGDRLAAHETFSGVHRWCGRCSRRGAGRFENQAVAEVLRLQRVQDLRQLAIELHVDDGADHLCDTAGAGVGGLVFDRLLSALAMA